MVGINVKLVTGRSLYQGTYKEKGKTSDEYIRVVSECQMDPEDMRKLGIREGEPVRVKTAYGSVVLRAVKTPEGSHPGVIFIPYGPWANVVVNPETHGTGMPSYKGVDAEVEPAPGEKVLDLVELLKSTYRRQ